MINLSQKEIDYAIAKERVNKIKKFYASLAIFILVYAFYSFRKRYLIGQINFFDDHNFSIVFWIWGIILAMKGIKIFFLNQTWERRMMDKELKRNQNGNL